MSCRNQDFDLDKQLSALTLEKTKVLKLTNVKNERKTSEIINLFPKIKDDLLVKWLDDSSVLVTFSSEETGFCISYFSSKSQRGFQTRRN